MDKNEKRISRCICLRALYAHASSYNSFTDIIENFFYESNNILDSHIKKEQIEYASKLFDLTINYLDDVDVLIKSKLVNWEIKRLALMDKIILRMSITEMLYVKNVPPKVSIAEGVEIAKEFSTDDSSGFVNGILDAIYNDNYQLEESKKTLLKKKS